MKSKNAEILNQKKLEERLKLFETRVKDSEAEIIRQKRHEERIGTLQKELERKTLDLFIKGTALEKRSLTLQEKLSDKSLDDRLSSLEQELVKKKRKQETGVFQQTVKLHSSPGTKLIL